MIEKVRVVIYGALSRASEDPDQTSIASQTAAVRAKLAQVYPDGYDDLGEFTDDGYSGSKGNRGPALQAAIDAAVSAAPCELWANTSARFGRGTGRRNEARSLNELHTDLRRAGVDLRTAADDEMVSPMLVGIGSTIAAKYSLDLSESIKRAKLRQLNRGDHLGGPVCDGYRIVPVYDDTGRMASRTFALDTGREAVVRSIFALASEGVPDAGIARRLNAQGTRTRHGRPFTRRAVQNTITNPWYAGRVAYKRGTADEQIVDGSHPALIDPAEFDRIQLVRAKRDLAEPSEHVIGRPAQNHALAKLARCGCGERLYAVTSSYRRKDGSRARSYQCHAYRFSTGTCDAQPIDAEVVDAAVIAGLDTLLVDFEAWRRRIEDGHNTERGRLAGEVERAQRAHDDQASKTEAMEAKWSEYLVTDEHKADLVLPMVERGRDDLTAAQRRLTAARDALASVPTEAPADAMLDFANDLQAAIRGRLDQSGGTMGEVNQALRELFVSFEVRETPGNGLFDGILIQPWLRVDVIAPSSDRETGWPWPALVKPDQDPPPLRWLSPEENVPNSQEYRLTK